MDSVPFYVGLDYHTRFVQVCVMHRDGQIVGQSRRMNDVREIVGYVMRFGSVVHAAIESCSGAADLAEELVRCGWHVDLAHSGYVHRMKQNPDKTDKTDAQLLADLVRVGYLPRVWLPPAHVRELRKLVRYRQQLVDERRDQKLRVSAILRENRVTCTAWSRWSKPWLCWVADCGLQENSQWIVDQHVRTIALLGQQIGEVEQRLVEQTADNELVHQLREFRGVGPVISWMMAAEVGRMDRFRSGKQLARFCGLSPRNASSGERQADAGLIKAANPRLRSVLVEGAHLVIRFDPRWKQLARQLRAAGKHPSLIAAAIANRWVRWMYAQIRAGKVAA